ncbi:AsmA-like C-terminal domain-containing protein [Geopsychrobacter electrodiphilus]|uniref:YhdP family protein n=1 Tax=Geopsychrobacter electrodiphilus TaxID=225196 RepID=UPI000360EA3B|nr:AsmA-like C-terminal domain-containing protein [Geopsychrobacter electrodiphilus]
MIRPARQHRSPLISLLIFVFVLSAILIVVALLRLDLGSYKQQLAERLGNALKMPVTLGDANLSFHGGIALDFRNLQIGNDEKFRLDVPKFTALVKPWELLRGEIIIEQIHIDAPRLAISLPLKLRDSAFNLDNLGLKTLQIRNGTLQITPESTSDPLSLNDFNLVYHGPGKKRISQLAIATTLQHKGQTSALSAFLELSHDQPDQPWRQGNLSGNITLRNLSTPDFAPLKFASLPRMFDLTLGVKGIPADGVQLDAALTGNQKTKALANLSANWQSTATTDTLRNLRLEMLGIPLTGDLLLSRKGDEPHLSGRLGASNLDLNPILSGPVPSLTNLAGRLETLEVILNGPLHPTADNPWSPLYSGTLKLDKLAYPLGTTSISNASLLLELQNARLSLKAGHAMLAKTPFTFSGTSGPLQQHPLEISFALTGSADLAQLQQESPSTFLKRQKLTGKMPFTLALTGSSEKLETNLTLDLTDTDLSISKLLEKKAGTPFHLDLKGQLTPQQMTISQANIRLAQSRIQLTGQFTQSEQNWSGALQLAPLELKPLQAVSPLFKDLQLHGKANGDLVLTPADWHGRISLLEAGAHLTHIIGDLNQTQGTFTLNREGIAFDKISTRLGESPLRVSGGLKNWEAPLISLHVTGKELRAQDLVFTNPDMKLQNLDGQLWINAGGITFDPVDVTVENRTTVRVSGQLRSYHDPQTYLEIQSDDADILDVIRLFTGHKANQGPNLSESHASLKIKAIVKKGRLGSLYFENAEGTIIDRNNIFTLYPLSVHFGKGRATGRVELDGTRNHLLKVSGQAQHCDADRVYEMLFEKKGIFRGTLSGDFYLEGEQVGEQFWKTSHGGGHLQIKDGAMRELNGFAKIFSLLNVAQLFKFSLPDMDKEGLPLSLLETSARMTDGILHFDDFHITSPAINISAVGQLNTLTKTIDCTLGIKPLRTIDIILSNVPLFGWVLTGDEEALITALFTLKGPIDNPNVSAAPASSIANTALGIIGRTLGLPLRMLQKTGKFLTNPPRPKTESPAPLDNGGQQQ